MFYNRCFIFIHILQVFLGCKIMIGSPAVGNVTKDLHNLFCKYSDDNWINIKNICPAMHEIRIFPSVSQVTEMVQFSSIICKRSKQCPQDSLSFGEFCIFVSTLQEQYKHGTIKPHPISRVPDFKTVQEKRIKKLQSLSKCEIFLGGSCNPTTWRKEIVIPILKNFSITYYNPQVACWSPEMIELEDQAKNKSEILFFVIDNQTRSVASIGEAAYLAGCQRPLILVMKSISGPGAVIMGEKITTREFEDLNMGHEFLHDLVERQGYPVFTDIKTAALCAVKVLHQGIQIQDLTHEDGVQPVKMAHAWTVDRLIAVRNAFDSVDTSKSGLIGWGDVCLAFKSITNTELHLSWLHKISNITNHRFTFDEFCCIVTEFRNQESIYKRAFSFLLTPLSGIMKIIRILFYPLSHMLSWIFPNWFYRNRDYSINKLTQKDVFLGGSCDNVLWREEIAIPLLKKHGLTYFNPVMPNWNAHFIPLEAAVMDNSRLLLFVITGQTRAIAAMALASYYIGQGSNVVLCIQNLNSDLVIAGEKISTMAVKDYNRGRLYLSDIANREGVPIFDNVTEAVICAINRLKNI